MTQVAASTTMARLPFRDKAALVAIKSAFAFSWGFLDVIAYLLTRRFATMMSGNTLLLAIQISDWKVRDMFITVTYIMSYVIGGAMHDAQLLVCKDDGRVVKYFVIPVVLLNGLLADNRVCIGSRKCELSLLFSTHCHVHWYCDAYPS